eukprot:6861190-Prymnesium_polylepis.2
MLLRPHHVPCPSQRCLSCETARLDGALLQQRVRLAIVMVAARIVAAGAHRAHGVDSPRRLLARAGRRAARMQRPRLYTF